MARRETVKQCQLCNLKTTSMSFLMRHLTEVHSNRPGFRFTCWLNNCQRTYCNITTYKHHVYAVHGQASTNLIPEVNNDNSSDEGSDESSSEDYNSFDIIDDQGPTETCKL